MYPGALKEVLFKDMQEKKPHEVRFYFGPCLLILTLFNRLSDMLLRACFPRTSIETGGLKDSRFLLARKWVYIAAIFYGGGKMELWINGKRVG